MRRLLVGRPSRAYPCAGVIRDDALRDPTMAGPPTPLRESLAINAAYSGWSRLMAARRTAALAKMRAAVSAANGNRCGWRMLALTGHRTMITAGVSFASTSSMVTVSVAVKRGRGLPDRRGGDSLSRARVV